MTEPINSFKITTFFLPLFVLELFDLPSGEGQHKLNTSRLWDDLNGCISWEKKLYFHIFDTAHATVY